MSNKPFIVFVGSMSKEHDPTTLAELWAAMSPEDQKFCKNLLDLCTPARVWKEHYIEWLISFEYSSEDAVLMKLVVPENSICGLNYEDGFPVEMFSNDSIRRIYG